MSSPLRAAVLAALLLAALAGPGAATDAFVRYHDSGDTNTPKFRYLNGTSLSGELNMVGVGATTKHFTAMAAAPTRHEYVHVAVQGGGETRAQVWKQSTQAWGDAVTLTTAGPGTSYASVAVAYERSSGDALAVYSDNTATPKYRVWDGASWGSQASLSVGTTGTVQQVRVASKAGSDTLAVVVGDANNDLYAAVWGGSAWGTGLTLTTASAAMTDGPFDLAWEGSSGDLLVAYDTVAATVQYRTLVGSTWSSQSTGPSIGTGQTPKWIRLAGRAGSDTVFLGAQDSAGQLELAVWSGTSWGSVTQATNKLSSSSARNFGLAAEGSSGDGLVAYGKDQATNKDRVRYRTYSTSWSAESDAPDISSGSDMPEWVSLVPDPRSDALAVLLTDGGGRVGFQRWSGSAWGDAAEPETSSDKSALNFAGAYRHTAPGLPWLDTDGTYPFETAAFGSVDTLQGGAGLEFADGVAGRVYDRTGVGAAGTWGQWAALPGATGILSGAGPDLGGRYLKARNLGTGAVAETFTFEACAENGEADLSHVRVESTYAPLDDAADGADGNGHAITSSERSATTKPTSGPGITTDGYAVWNPTSTSADCLAVQYRYTWDMVPSGTSTQTASARDSAGTWAQSLAAHGDTTQFDSSATATLDFTDTSFAGAVDAAFQVDLDGRIDFHWHVGTETDPSTVATWEGSSLDDADGAVAIAVNTPGQIVWVYHAVDIVSPAGLAVLLDQSYTASYTWS